MRSLSTCPRNAKCAKCLHFGGVIKAGSDNPDAMRRRRPGARGKYLTIPLTKEARKKRAGDFDNTFVFKSKRGNLLLAQRRPGKANRGRGAMKLLYVLKASVTLKKQPYMFWSRSDRKYLTGAIMRRLEGLIGK